jgi:hypothetical protein
MNEETHLISTSSVDVKIGDIAREVLKEENPDKAKELISLFNWNMSKKNVARILKLNQLYDNVTDQMATRLSTRSDQFTNSDLLDYMKTIQGAIDTSTKNMNQVEEPPLIVQQNTQINVNMGDKFDRDAKERILAAIQATLNSANTSSNQEDSAIEVEAETITSQVIESNEVQLPTAEDIIEELNSQTPEERIITSDE